MFSFYSDPDENVLARYTTRHGREVVLRGSPEWSALIDHIVSITDPDKLEAIAGFMRIISQRLDEISDELRQ